MSRALASIVVTSVLAGCASMASPVTPDAAEPADAPAVTACTFTLTGALVGTSACDNSPAVADSGALDSYVLAGAPRRTTVQLSSSNAHYALGSIDAVVELALPITIDGAPVATTYRRGDPAFIAARDVLVDTTDPSTHRFTSWELADDAPVTLTLAGVVMTSENAADSGQQRFIGHGTLDLTLAPSATDDVAVGSITAHVAF